MEVVLTSSVRGAVNGQPWAAMGSYMGSQGRQGVKTICDWKNTSLELYIIPSITYKLNDRCYLWYYVGTFFIYGSQEVQFSILVCFTRSSSFVFAPLGIFWGYCLGLMKHPKMTLQIIGGVSVHTEIERDYFMQNQDVVYYTHFYLHFLHISWAGWENVSTQWIGSLKSHWTKFHVKTLFYKTFQY